MPQKHKIFPSREALEDNIPLRGMIEMHLEGRSVAVARTKEGVYAFLNECPHNKAKLSEGLCNWHNEVVCPWHNYRFDLQSGREGTGRSLNLQTYHIEISDDGVYLEL